MSKKKLNVEAITNELQNSAFFPSQHFPAQGQMEKQETREMPVPPIAKHVSTETGKRENTKTRFSLSPTEQAQGFQFDPSTKADQKYTLLFTEQELEILEDIKTDLRRHLGIKTTKIELVRCGLGELIEDYQHHRDQSRLVTRLKTRKHENT